MSSAELFPGLAETIAPIEPGYEVINGDASETNFQPEHLLFRHFEAEGPLPGVNYIADYIETDDSGSTAYLPVISFLYHKEGPDGQLETQERVIIWRGIGFGTHPGHTGQEASYYFSGSQIGTIDYQTGRFSKLETEPQVIDSKHFSIDCISAGPTDPVVLANPKQ